MRISSAMLAAAGFLAGIAFVVACPSPKDSGGDGTSDSGTTLEVGTATASHDLPASSCPQWEYQLQQAGLDSPQMAPAGWEPIGGGGNGIVVLRRCM